MRFCSIVSVLLCCLSINVFAQDGFVKLFTAPDGTSWTENGKEIAGFIKRGGDATFTVENGELVGKRGPGTNTFLCTSKKYSNFIMKFDFKFDIECNSGVQFRSDFITKDGRDILVGYQCEMATGAQTANVYDEHRRNRFLVDKTDELQEKINKAEKKGEWNSITIQCVGPSIKTWLNGEKIVDFFDIETNEGIFGFQVHSGNTGQVRWKNIMLKELPATPWIPLYANGKINEDIEIKPVGEWTIQDDGVWCGKTPDKEPRDGIVVTKTKYKDFAAKVSFKMEKGNSGLYFRSQDALLSEKELQEDESGVKKHVNKPYKTYWLKGFQCEIAEGNAVNANLWEVQGRGWVQKTEQTQEMSKKATNVKEWNNIGTVAVGPRISTFLNGWQVMNVIDETPTYGFEGFIGLQLHGGGSQGCLFNNFYVMPLNDEAVKLIEK
ncbi:MAG: DUF1080 domain-containing protein [Planctomycetaceae bacterium]|nr:DUF1080 domain-containing protein [Planctomycetaceae bacterium]